MKQRLWGLAKSKFYEDLAKSLINSKNVYNDGCIGWAREANLSVSSPMNTGEVLLGLLYSSNVISQGALSREIKKCVKGGVRFLIKNQCFTGGWTTSESNELNEAEGNMMTSAIAIWAIVEYIILHDEPSGAKECLDKALSFIQSCKLSDSIYRFRPSADKYSNMSTLYALIGLVNLNIYYAEKNDSLNCDVISNLIKAVLTDFQKDKYTSFELMFLMMILKKIDCFNELMKYPYPYKDILFELENESRLLTEKKYLDTYKDVRYIRENGEKSEFFYYTPIWVLCAISYGTATNVPYRNHLIRSVVNKYFVVQDNKIQVMVGERTWTWATAQTLMAFSMYGASQSVGDFLNLEEEKDCNSAFIVYGRNTSFKTSIENCLRAIGVKTYTFDNNGGNIQSTLDAVIQGMNKTALSIVLLTGDDEGRCNKKYLLNNDKTKIYEKQLTPQPRMNVVFEAGYSYALRNNANTVIISTNTVRPFTDIDGINKLILDVDKKGQPVPGSIDNFKDKFIEILKNCGCCVPDAAKEILKAIPLQF